MKECGSIYITIILMITVQCCSISYSYYTFIYTSVHAYSAEGVKRCHVGGGGAGAALQDVDDQVSAEDLGLTNTASQTGPSSPQALHQLNHVHKYSYLGEASVPYISAVTERAHDRRLPWPEVQ